MIKVRRRRALWLTIGAALTAAWVGVDALDADWPSPGRDPSPVLFAAGAASCIVAACRPTLRAPWVVAWVAVSAPIIWRAIVVVHDNGATEWRRGLFGLAIYGLLVGLGIPAIWLRWLDPRDR